MATLLMRIQHPMIHATCICTRNHRVLMLCAKLIGIVLLISAISGCIPSSCSSCSPPKEALAEIAVLGATITTETRPFPYAVGQRFLSAGAESGVYSGILTIYFSPDPEHEVIDDFKIGDYLTPSKYPYEYTFSHLVDDEYVDLPSKDSYQQNDPEYYYYGITSLSNYPEILLGTANHLISSWPSSPTFPARATHIELWYRELENDEKRLVRRIPLESFFAWRRYVKPEIERNCGNGC